MKYLVVCPKQWNMCEPDSELSILSDAAEKLSVYICHCG